jgi:hypothetical protein
MLLLGLIFGPVFVIFLIYYQLMKERIVGILKHVCYYSHNCVHTLNHRISTDLFKLQPYALAGFDLIAHSSIPLGWQAETIPPLDHAARATN